MDLQTRLAHQMNLRTFGESVVYHAEAELVLHYLPKDCINLVFTDPPYPRQQARPCYELLATQTARVMTDGASLVTIAPHYLLEEIMLMFHESGQLKWRWLLNMDQNQGSHPRMAMGIEVCFKPLLWYVKRAYPQGRGFLKDEVIIPEKEKGMHQWQQSEAWAEYYIAKLTQPGDLVLDPFFGSGTVGRVCQRLGRTFIGIDNDPAAFELAVERLSKPL